MEQKPHPTLPQKASDVFLHKDQFKPDPSKKAAASAGQACGLTSVAEMLPGDIEKHSHVRIIKAVEHHPTVAARLHDSGGSEKTKCMRDIRLGRARRSGDIADAELPRFEQCVEKAGASGVAQQPKELCELLEFLPRQKLSLRGFNASFIDDFDSAGIESDDFGSHVAPPLANRYMNS